MKYFLFQYIMPWLCRMVKLFGTPGPLWRRRLKFIGPVTLKTEEGKKLKLFNKGFFLENELFWLGLEGFDWEKISRKVWAEHCSKAQVILDIGANTGIFSVIAHTINPEARIIAFEPQPNIFNVLKRNSSLNG